MKKLNPNKFITANGLYLKLMNKIIPKDLILESFGTVANDLFLAEGLFKKRTVDPEAKFRRRLQKFGNYFSAKRRILKILKNKRNKS